MSIPAQLPYRPGTKWDVALYCTYLALIAASIATAPDLWPFLAAISVGVVAIVAMHWAKADRDRIAGIRDLSAGLTAAGTFFAAYSAEIDKTTQGGALLIMVTPVALTALLASMRLRRLDRWHAEKDEEERRREEAERHDQVVALLRRLPGPERPQ